MALPWDHVDLPSDRDPAGAYPVDLGARLDSVERVAAHPEDQPCLEAHGQVVAVAQVVLAVAASHVLHGRADDAAGA